MASCGGGEGLSPERKACLESAKTEAERFACNNAAALRADQEKERAWVMRQASLLNQ